MKISNRKKKDIYVIFAHNIDCGYTLEQHRRGGSYENPQILFRIKIREIDIPLHTPAYHSHLLYKSMV